MLVFRHLKRLFVAAMVVATMATVVLGDVGDAAADQAIPPDDGASESGDEQFELECGFLLTDQGDVLGDATPIVVAAEPLEQFGTVRIRVFDQTAAGSLDDALAEIADGCGWTDPTGEYQPDLFVFGVSVGDRATRVLYGSDWAPTLDDSASVIIDRVVNSQFANGNYQGGIIDGLGQFTSLRSDGEPGSGPDDAAEPAVDDAPPAEESDPGVADTVTDEAFEEQETIEPVPTPADTDDVAATNLTPTAVESQGSKMGTYLLIGAVLVAIVVLPALFLARGREDG